MATRKTVAKKHGGAGRGQGRKPLSTRSESVIVSVRMTNAQRKKLSKLGGSPWVRECIDGATA